jgi:hypothetical protein
VIKGGFMFPRCPTSWIRNEGAELSALYADAAMFIDRGVLPHGGGMLDQPARFLQALAIVQGMVRD